MRLLGPIADELVFVGGRVAELLITQTGRTRVRPTDDSDAICEVATRTAYHELGERLRTAGFREDQSPGAPVCGWRHADEQMEALLGSGLAEDVVAAALPDARLVPDLVSDTIRRLEGMARLE